METELIKLNPEWLSSGGKGVFISATGEPAPLNPYAGLALDCPCGCGERRFIPTEKGHGHLWHIKDSVEFDKLTLTPSIQVTTGCRTHYHITDGKITP